MAHNCLKCGMLLVIGENVTQYRIDHSRYICRSCNNEYSRTPAQRKHRLDYNHRTRVGQPMEKNRECALYLGVHVAERVLSHVFQNVTRMPFGYKGFDFICSREHKIDVKSACRNRQGTRSDSWNFRISRNKIADYFLCLGFDNRESLNPEHIWLIPGSDVNDRAAVGISESKLPKWQEYERDCIDKVTDCCNTLKMVGDYVTHDENGAMI